MACNIPQKAPIGKVPREGPGYCYHSRVLHSTFRYAKFVKRLRAQEDEQRRGAENNLRTLKDRQISDFFTSCDRRSLINTVARRVDLCMAAYQDDLHQKRQRLTQLFAAEEEANIRKLVEAAQAGAEQVWRDKQDRLQYLLDKRKKEHQQRYKDTPLSKCVHVLPSIYKLRAKEAAEIQRYQIREKQAKKMAELEFDKMWHEVAMKESDALKARMELDAIERFRRDLECKQYSDCQLEQLKQRREQEKQMLIEETKRFKSIWDEDNKKEKEAERIKTEKRIQTAKEMDEIIRERKEMLQRQEEEENKMQDTWASLASQGLQDESEKVQLARKKERENVISNRHLVCLKQDKVRMEKADDRLVKAESEAIQKKLDEQRCAHKLWSQKTNREVREAMVNQIRERATAREQLKQKLCEQDEYHSQLFRQTEELSQLKQIEEAQAREAYQNQLLQQIDYNKTLKERALQEEREQLKIAKLAAEEYEKEIKTIMNRSFFSEEVHPFMKQMSKGLTMKDKCPCSHPDYCQQ